MNSVKNLLVVVLLMGVSYGAFQVINTPDPTLTGDVPDIEEIDIQNGPRQFSDPDSSTAGPFPPSSPAESFAKNTPRRKLSVPDKRESPSIPNLPPGIQMPDANKDRMDRDLVDAAPDLLPEEPKVSTDTLPLIMPNSGGAFLPNSNTTDQPESSQTITSANTFVPPDVNAIPFRPQTDLQPVTPRPTADSAGQQVTQLDDPASPLGQNTNNGLAQGSFANPSMGNTGNAMPVSQTSNVPPTNAIATSPIDWSGIAEMANNGNVSQALFDLSQRYSEPLPADQRMQLLSWLDQLAGKVIYSTEHHLQARPYIVAEGDTLESIAARWNVPPQLVYNINRSKFGESTTPVPGTELKVVQGPFNAQISLDRLEMTLFLDGMYAGRFPIELGQDHQYQPGSFMIESKSLNGRDYQEPSGKIIAAGAADNPYGRYWLGFSNSQLCIHESPDMGSNGNMNGCIRVAARDAEDIYGILSEGSQVSIMR